MSKYSDNMDSYLCQRATIPPIKYVHKHGRSALSLQQQVFRLFLEWLQYYNLVKLSLKHVHRQIDNTRPLKELFKEHAIGLDQCLKYWIDVESYRFSSTISKNPRAVMSLRWPLSVASIPEMNTGKALKCFFLAMPNFKGKMEIPLETLVDEDFRQLSRITDLHILNLGRCCSVPNKGWSHLRNLSKLSVPQCPESIVSSVSLLKLPKLRKLNIARCNQTIIGDSTFRFFGDLRALDMAFCCQTTISDNGFTHLSNLTKLFMNQCTQSTISSKAFEHLASVEALNLSGCTQTTLCSELFRPLTKLKRVRMIGVDQPSIADLAFSFLERVTDLDMSGCTQTTITDKAFEHLTSLESLNMSTCAQTTITDSAFGHLKSLTALYLADCDGFPASLKALSSLSSLVILDASRCNQLKLADISLHLGHRLKQLSMDGIALQNETLRSKSLVDELKQIRKVSFPRKMDGAFIQL